LQVPKLTLENLQKHQFPLTSCRDLFRNMGNPPAADDFIIFLIKNSPLPWRDRWLGSVKYNPHPIRRWKQG
jgi:hypothetical protein